VTTLRRNGRDGWTVVTDNGNRHENLTTADAAMLWLADARARHPDVRVVVGDVARITSPRPTPGEPTITDEEAT
jgi:hypothetical protein